MEHYQRELSVSDISSGFPAGFEIQRFVESRTAKTQQSVSSLMLNTQGQDSQWLEEQIRRKTEMQLTQFISRQKMKSYDTNFGKTFTMEAVILSQEELYALMDWAAKKHITAPVWEKA